MQELPISIEVVKSRARDGTRTKIGILERYVLMYLTAQRTRENNEMAVRQERASKQVPKSLRA